MPILNEFFPIDPVLLFADRTEKSDSCDIYNVCLRNVRFAISTDIYRYFILISSIISLSLTFARFLAAFLLVLRNLAHAVRFVISRCNKCNKCFYLLL